MSSTKFLLATSSILCLTVAANAHSADLFKNNPEHDALAKSNISFRTTEQNRNPVIQALERHNAFSKDQDLEYFLEHVLSVAQATPDYVKGYGADRPTSPDHTEQYLPRQCKLAIEEGELGEWNEFSNWNVVFWDGISLDSTGTRPFINGTTKKDVIIGTAFSDIIFGLGGQDFVCSLDGDDTVFGDGKDWTDWLDNDGGDRIFGGPGDDTLYGGGEWDYLVGGSGHDTLLGGGGINWLEGDGTGFFIGTELPFELHGDDFLVGLGYANFYGQGGNDTVNSTSYNESGPASGNFFMDDKEDGFTDSCFVFDYEKEEAADGGCEIINEY